MDSWVRPICETSLAMKIVVDIGREVWYNRVMNGILEEGFVALRAQGCGIYLLCQGQQVVYVGQSKQIYGRVAQHLTRVGKAPTRKMLMSDDVPARRIPFDRIYVRWCE